SRGGESADTWAFATLGSGRCAPEGALILYMNAGPGISSDHRRSRWGLLRVDAAAGHSPTSLGVWPVRAAPGDGRSRGAAQAPGQPLEEQGGGKDGEGCAVRGGARRRRVHRPQRGRAEELDQAREGGLVREAGIGERG